MVCFLLHESQDEDIPDASNKNIAFFFFTVAQQTAKLRNGRGCSCYSYRYFAPTFVSHHILKCFPYEQNFPVPSTFGVQFIPEKRKKKGKKKRKKQCHKENESQSKALFL